MKLMDRMVQAEEAFCDKLDAAGGPVVILGRSLERSWIIRILAEDDYAAALDQFMRDRGIDPDGE
jgi:hypothetical protein